MNPYRDYVLEPVNVRKPRFFHTLRRKLLVWWYGKFTERCIVKCRKHGIHNCKCPDAVRRQVRHNIMRLSMTPSLPPRDVMITPGGIIGTSSTGPK